MASRADLVRKILKALGVWQAGQDLPPEDYKAVDQELPTRLLAMSKAGIYTATVTNIPDEAVDAIADYLAERYSKDFGIVAGDELVQLKTDAARAEGDLRFLNTMRPTYARNRPEYF
jgi:hypothetical protein